MKATSRRRSRSVATAAGRRSVVPGGPVPAIVLGVLTALWVLAASWFLTHEHLPLPAAGARPAMGH
ncbi:hypothetical protein [Nonomuraea sp. NPDC050786]|uniref:hypothetical protein n=1 Tax=Nonomuraea sp. NPDC050786 TaxID=3154840 RepID=UPI0034079593